MTQRQIDRGPVWWRVLMFVGIFAAVGGQLAGEPFVTVVGGPLGIVGVVGLLVARRKQQQQ